MKELGPAMVSATILALYAAHMMGVAHGPWGDGDARLLETCLTLVVGYWLGSSAGSVRKTEIMGTKP